MASELLGLTTKEVADRRREFGQNILEVKKLNPVFLLLRQFNNPILWLLTAAILLSSFLGDVTNALIILVVVSLSAILGFITEYRAERAIADLHSRISHHATVIRDGVAKSITNAELVPGDIVKLRIGSIVPADIKLLEVKNLEIDENIITGESVPVSKGAEKDPTNPMANVAMMGTTVRNGTGTGEVIAIGGKTEFGSIAKALGQLPPTTNFQEGLKEFSEFLLKIAIAIAAIVTTVNIYLDRPFIESILYALAISVGMTPQLLPAIVSTSLALGSRKLSKNGVLVKRLVSIEDLGDLDILITDKTGTLTTGEINFEASYPIGDIDPIVGALLAIDGEYQEALKSQVGLSTLDSALWEANKSKFLIGTKKLDVIPFDHNRRMISVLIENSGVKKIIVKGSPEEVIAKCSAINATSESLLKSLYAQGARVIAVAEKCLNNQTSISPKDEEALELLGFLTFSDPLKPNIRDSLLQLSNLGIEVKVATGDSVEVAVHICEQAGLSVKKVITGKEIEELTDNQLLSKLQETTIFARVSPEQKAKIISGLRSQGFSVGFLGDGVNDAIALHDSDVGISVDSATDIAKDASDIVLLEKDLGVLANGIRQGRIVFSNTMKYIFMATSADFGNLISASIGSFILPYLPMLPVQVLLQDLLYDSSQLALPMDRVDREQIARPSHWNIRQIRRFMWVFGLASSIFDFLTFVLLIWVLKAKAAEFHTGWFIESLATATLVVLAIRTRRVPFFKSTPARALIFSLISINLLAILLTYIPIGRNIGFVNLPLKFYLFLFMMIIFYLVLVEILKKRLLNLGFRFN